MEQAPKDQDQKPLGADTSDPAIGKRIRDARDAKGLTQSQVSVRSKWSDPDGKGISRTALIGYEAGTSRPGTRELRILCETLHVTPNQLIYGTEHPFQASHVALEGLRHKRRAVSVAMQVAFLVMALKDHEKDALLSLALSLGGHTLGDARLAGLRAMAGLLTNDLIGTFREYFADLSDEEFQALSMEELAQLMSKGLAASVGTKFQFDEDGEIVGGEQQYPDPEG